jgi:rhodanese-related sulfurtransferase
VWAPQQAVSSAISFNSGVHSFDVPSVTVDELAPGVPLLDVREDDEWAAGHIADAVHIPMGAVPAVLAANPELFDRELPLVIVCAVGGRSGQVAGWLNRQGYDAINLIGGMHAWAQAGRPMQSDTGADPTVL